MDSQIIELFWYRDERGLQEAKDLYGEYCYRIAYNILNSRQDAEECESDTFWTAWNLIPPQRPGLLRAFLGKIARNLSLKRLRANTAQKRGGGIVPASLEELAYCIPEHHSFDERVQAQELADIISDFLRSLPETERKVFICRYWYCDDIKTIAQSFRFTESKVKMMLLRTRNKLQDYLVKEGMFYEG